MKDPSWKEIQSVVKAARSASSPGQSGVPYTVYKRCPTILKHLWRIIKTIWRKRIIPKNWKRSNGIWIPKEENSKDINQFRIISLLDTEGKIFFSILARRLTSFLHANEYLDTSIQKAGVADMPGCVEHTGVLMQIIREAKENRVDLEVV